MKCCCLGQKASEEPNSPASTYDLASGTMKSFQEQHIVSAEKDLQFEFTPNIEDAVGTCTYNSASGTMKSVQEQYISSAAAATITTTKTRKERFYIVRTEEGSKAGDRNYDGSEKPNCKLVINF
ncbi:hypothetical protein ABFA07_001351 [Porites harrisoni]